MIGAGVLHKSYGEQQAHKDYLSCVEKYLSRKRGISSERVVELIRSRQFYGLNGFKLSHPYKELKQHLRRGATWAKCEIYLCEYVNLNISLLVELQINPSSRKVENLRAEILSVEVDFFNSVGMCLSDYLNSGYTF